jgi:hypothetical protein
MPNCLGCGTVHQENNDGEYLDAAGPRPADARLSIRLFVRRRWRIRAAGASGWEKGFSHAPVIDYIEIPAGR